MITVLAADRRSLSGPALLLPVRAKFWRGVVRRGPGSRSRSLMPRAELCRLPCGADPSSLIGGVIRLENSHNSSVPADHGTARTLPVLPRHRAGSRRTEHACLPRGSRRVLPLGVDRRLARSVLAHHHRSDAICTRREPTPEVWSAKATTTRLRALLRFGYVEGLSAHALFDNPVQPSYSPRFGCRFYTRDAPTRIDRDLSVELMGIDAGLS